MFVFHLYFLVVEKGRERVRSIKVDDISANSFILLQFLSGLCIGLLCNFDLDFSPPWSSYIVIS